MQDFLEQNQDSGLKITLSQEREPLGTAGPLALAKELLDDGEPFFVMNCDVACEMNLRALLDFHRAHGKVGTILATRVDEPAKYGKSVVVAHDTGLIDRFVEHGRTFAGNLINAGVYIFSPSIFERLSLRPTSMEKEVAARDAAHPRRKQRARAAASSAPVRACHASMLAASCATVCLGRAPSHASPQVLPSLAAEEQLYCKTLDPLDGFWMNIKKPPDFLQGTSLYLRYLRRHQHTELAAPPAPGERTAAWTCDGNVILDPSASIGAGSKLGPDVVVGAGCVVEEGVRLSRCILLEGARVCAHAVVLDSILGWRSTVGSWTRVEGVSVLGEDVHIGPELCVNGALILPHKEITESVAEPKIIM